MLSLFWRRVPLAPAADAWCFLGILLVLGLVAVGGDDNFSGSSVVTSPWP